MSILFLPIMAIECKIRYPVVFSDVKIVIDNLIRYINPIVYMKNSSMSSTRYFWSSLQNVTGQNQLLENISGVKFNIIMFVDGVGDSKYRRNIKDFWWIRFITSDCTRKGENLQKRAIEFLGECTTFVNLIKHRLAIQPGLTGTVPVLRACLSRLFSLFRNKT